MQDVTKVTVEQKQQTFFENVLESFHEEMELVYMN